MGRSITHGARYHFHGYRSKNSFTMSKTDRRPNAKRSGYRRRNGCDGKLVAYILEDEFYRFDDPTMADVSNLIEMVEPIGIEPMT